MPIETISKYAIHKLDKHRHYEVLSLLQAGSFSYWLCKEHCKNGNIDVFVDVSEQFQGALICADDDTILILGRAPEVGFSQCAYDYLENEGKPNHGRPCRLFLHGTRIDRLHVELQQVCYDQKETLANLMELYDYDFSAYEERDISDSGKYSHESINELLGDSDVIRYLITVEGKLAGFAFVGNQKVYTKADVVHNIADFFVMRRFRRYGIGKYVAKLLFQMYEGHWEVLQMPNNLPAKQFWRSVINEYTAGVFEECGSDEEEWVGFLFKSPNS